MLNDANLTELFWTRPVVEFYIAMLTPVYPLRSGVLGQDEMMKDNLENRESRAVWERPALVRMDAIKAESGPGMAVEMIGGGTGDNGMRTS